MFQMPFCLSSRENGVARLSESELPAATAATRASVGAISGGETQAAAEGEGRDTGSAAEDDGGSPVMTVRLPSPPVETVQHFDLSEPTPFEHGGDESCMFQEGGEGIHTYVD